MIWSSRISQIAAPQGSVPKGTRIYAIGDIHGRLDLLDSVLARIDLDVREYPASNVIRVFLGDYIDPFRIGTAVDGVSVALRPF